VSETWTTVDAVAPAIVGAAFAVVFTYLFRWFTAKRVRWVAFDRFPSGADGAMASSLVNVGDADAFEVRVTGLNCTVSLIDADPRDRVARAGDLGAMKPLIGRVASGTIVGVVAWPEDAHPPKVNVTWTYGGVRWRWLARRSQIVTIAGDSGTESGRP